MQLIRNRPGQHSATAGERTVVAVGNFDGVHLGHQQLITHSKDLAESGESVAVVTFEPLPQAFFNPQKAPARLSTVYQKLDLLAHHGVDRAWLMRFDLALSRLQARDFVREVLVEGLAACKVVVGADFRFGHRREGDVLMLRDLGVEFGFGVEIFSAVFLGESRISSTAIRQALAEGELDKAAAMLGRPFRMEGHVVRGEQLGRDLGYPTANLRIRARPQPIAGIFAVWVRVNGAWHAAVANVGWRPTVGGKEPLLEVHVFDFEGHLYGQRLEVEFVAKLREETRFENIEQLVTQMRRDELEARRILAFMDMPE